MKNKENKEELSEYLIRFKLELESSNIHERYYTETSKEMVLNNLAYHIKKEYDCEPLVESVFKYNRFSNKWENI